MNGIIGERLAR
ncbi:hypothetical protein D044_4319A, partial [Vibrio parahaemolyticus EKP-026]